MTLNTQAEFSLKSFSTFATDVTATEIHEIFSIAELKETLKRLLGKQFVLVGGGSNTIFTKNLAEPVVVNKLKGVRFFSRDDKHFVTVAAGESWPELVTTTVEKGYFGLENLALIPGSVGAAPVQNIGAYGVEIKDRLVSVTAIDIETLATKTLSNSECHFSYRDSRFKHEWRNRYIILDVTLELSRDMHTVLSYPGLNDYFLDKNQNTITSKAIYERVCSIRHSKLPDPKLVPNVGSFFKNPVISKAQYQLLKSRYESMPAYPVSEYQIKLAAGWLIDNAGWKGRGIGPVGMHEKQALVMINYGGATGKDVLNLMHVLQDEIHDKYGVELEPEPVLI